MNELIGLLERAGEKAESEVRAFRASPIDTEALDVRALLEMGLDHLRDTLVIFRRARTMRNELERVKGKE